MSWDFLRSKIFSLVLIVFSTFLLSLRLLQIIFCYNPPCLFFEQKRENGWF